MLLFIFGLALLILFLYTYIHMYWMPIQIFSLTSSYLIWSWKTNSTKLQTNKPDRQLVFSNWVYHAKVPGAKSPYKYVMRGYRIAPLNADRCLVPEYARGHVIDGVHLYLLLRRGFIAGCMDTFPHHLPLDELGLGLGPGHTRPPALCGGKIILPLGEQTLTSRYTAKILQSSVFWFLQQISIYWVISLFEPMI